MFSCWQIYEQHANSSPNCVVRAVMCVYIDIMLLLLRRQAQLASFPFSKFTNIISDRQIKSILREPLIYEKRE